MWLIGIGVPLLAAFGGLIYKVISGRFSSVHARIGELKRDAFAKIKCLEGKMNTGLAEVKGDVEKHEEKNEKAYVPQTLCALAREIFEKELDNIARSQAETARCAQETKDAVTTMTAQFGAFLKAQEGKKG